MSIDINEKLASCFTKDKCKQLFFPTNSVTIRDTEYDINELKINSEIDREYQKPEERSFWNKRMKKQYSSLPTSITDTDNFSIVELNAQHGVTNTLVNCVHKTISPKSSAKYSLQMLSNKVNKTDKRVTRTTIVELDVTEAQKKLFDTWAKYYRLCYNMMSRIQWADPSFVKDKKVMSAISLQNISLFKGAYKNTPERYVGHKVHYTEVYKNIPSHIRDSVAAKVVGNYRAIIARHGKKKVFKMPKMLCNKQLSIFTIGVGGYRICQSKKGLSYFRMFPELLREQNIPYVFNGKSKKDKETINNLRESYERDDSGESRKTRSTIIIQKKYNRYYLKYPEHLLVSQNTSDTISAFDPGVRKFLTIVNNKDKLYVIDDEISYIASMVAKKMERVQRLCNEKKMSERHCKLLSNKYKAMADRIIDDFHCKLAKYMAINNRAIIAPEIGNFLAHTGLSFATRIKQRLIHHSNFSRRLLEACEKYGCEYLYSKEYKTSMTCSFCGHEDKTLGSSETFNCAKCKKIIDRDANAARNIMMRFLFRN